MAAAGDPASVEMVRAFFSKICPMRLSYCLCRLTMAKLSTPQYGPRQAQVVAGRENANLPSLSSGIGHAGRVKRAGLECKTKQDFERKDVQITACSDASDSRQYCDMS